MDALNVPKEDARFRTYATSQVSRWEQVQSGRVCPPEPRLMILTRCGFASTCWARKEAAIVLDLTGLEVPVELLAVKECVTILQALLFKAGFQFDDLVQVWLYAQVSKLVPESVRALETCMSETRPSTWDSSVSAPPTDA
ncbi:hypothetical protein PC116_g13910 [Phytophthora cactorum]|uniref:Uncharacterized protein n=2 Tax=Phytophthora cactorum TaxID=29920 RepID=A0A8T1ESE7_9STRA|nr:hypothetical protein PC111_g12971 [Phytophthora cactorum]KAG2959925.1 hypothetical protein PC118_g22771 [Phytophthora cactorum]KAG4238043.1 hypothetical protein PC116_g13910 [Phytophthora cactorum]